LGDSLALDVYPYLADLLPDRYVSYQAKVGRSTAQISEALALMTEIPNVVIVSAGTNDWASSDFTTSAESIMTMLGPHRCVVWMDTARPQRTDPNLGLQEPASAINTALDTLAAEHTNIHIVRWSVMAAAHPEWFGSDGIHPNDDGIKVRAHAMADAALQCSALNPSAPPAPHETLPADIVQ
jgi:lysophospholipase L1-like esterase